MNPTTDIGSMVIQKYGPQKIICQLLFWFFVITYTYSISILSGNLNKILLIDLAP